MAPVSTQQPSSTGEQAMNAAADARNTAAEHAGMATEKVKAVAKQALQPDNATTTTATVAHAEKQGQEEEGLVSMAAHLAIDTAASVVNTTAGVVGQITHTGVNVVKGAAKLGTGAVIEGTELGVGIGATMLDAAGNVIQTAADTVCRVQQRGHQVTQQTSRAVRDTIIATHQLGGDVIDRVTGKTIAAAGKVEQVGAEMAVKGIETAERIGSAVSEKAGQVAGKGTEVASQVYDSAAGAAEKAKVATGQAYDKTKQVASQVEETAEQKAKEAAKKAQGVATQATHLAQGAVDKGQQIAGEVKEAAKEKTLQADKSAREMASRAGDVGQSMAGAAKDKAGDVAQSAKETAESVAQAGKSKASGAARSAEDKTRREGSTGTASTTLSSHDSATDLSSKDTDKSIIGSAADVATTALEQTKHHFELGEQKEAIKQQEKQAQKQVAQ